MKFRNFFPTFVFFRKPPKGGGSEKNLISEVFVISGLFWNEVKTGSRPKKSISIWKFVKVANGSEHEFDWRTPRLSGWVDRVP